MPPQDAPKYTPPRVPEARPGQRGSPRHVNRLRRTAALCEGALDCFLRQGLDAVTIDHITRSAGTAKGSFYRYFDHKEQLVCTLFQPLGDAVSQALDDATNKLEAAQTPAALIAAYEGLGGALLPLMATHSDLIRLFLQERSGPPSPERAPLHTLERTVIDHAVHMTLAARTHGLIRSDLNAQVSASVVVGAVFQLLHEQLRRPTPTPPIEAITTLIDLVLDGVRAKPRP